MQTAAAHAIAGEDARHTDPEKVLAVIERSIEVFNAEEFLALIANEVHSLIPHEMMVCGFGGVGPKGGYVHKVLQKNYPIKYFEELLQPDGRLDSPLTALWRETREPVMYQSGRDDAAFPARWVRIFNKFDLRNTVGHGMLDMQGTLGSYFVFTRIPGQVGARHLHLLKLITPHLHLAFVRATATISDLGNYAGALHSLLSRRQLEIVFWMHEGKTNWEIACILQTTEKNVKYHIQQILLKLDVANRTQAVASAVALGLLKDAPPGISPRETAKARAFSVCGEDG